jgi:hypothetical protein
MEGNTVVAEMGGGGEIEVAHVSSRAGSEPEGSSELRVVDHGICVYAGANHRTRPVKNHLPSELTKSLTMQSSRKPTAIVCTV